MSRDGSPNVGVVVKKPVSTVYVLGNKNNKKKNDDGSPKVGVVVKKPVSTVYVLGNKKKKKKKKLMMAAPMLG